MVDSSPSPGVLEESYESNAGHGASKHFLPQEEEHDESPDGDAEEEGTDSIEDFISHESALEFCDKNFGGGDFEEAPAVAYRSDSDNEVGDVGAGDFGEGPGGADRADAVGAGPSAVAVELVDLVGEEAAPALLAARGLPPPLAALSLAASLSGLSPPVARPSGLAGKVTKPPIAALSAAAQLAGTELPGRAMAPRRVLVVGDLQGRIDMLHVLLNDLQGKHELPDFVLACGRFLSDTPETGFIESYLGKAPRLTLPTRLYFVDSASQTFINRSVRRGGKPVRLSPQMVFLGSHGLIEIDGLQVAYLSGTHREQLYKDEWKDGPFIGSHYTEAVMNELRCKISDLGRRPDVFLTCEGPDLEWSRTHKRLLQPMVAGSAMSSAVRKLCFDVQPRYHICSGPRYIYQKAQPQGPGGAYMGNFLSAAPLGVDVDFAGEPLRRWWRLLHVLTSRALAAAARLAGGGGRPPVLASACLSEALGAQRASGSATAGILGAAKSWLPQRSECPERPAKRQRRTRRESSPELEVTAVALTPVALARVARARLDRLAQRAVAGSRCNVGPFPPGWVARWSQTHRRPFYVNTKTHEKVWELPKR